jgi:hypothetical protein
MSVKDTLQNLVPHKQMQFSPVPDDDDDELSQFIASDPLAHDNMWDLHEGVDAQKLDDFWSDALKELGPLETEQDDQL